MSQEEEKPLYCLHYPHALGMRVVPQVVPQSCREWVDAGLCLIGGQGRVTFVGLLSECESGCLWVRGTGECLLAVIDADVDSLVNSGYRLA